MKEVVERMAMTRSGKGQTFIEPTIDAWLRLDKKRNIAINDPKGELYKKFYYPAQMRGFQVVAFNLINPDRTDIYNPLMDAVDAARKGNIQQVSEIVENIGKTFFPADKADDPMWPNAANAAFQRAALGLIDYYREEEGEMKAKALREHWSQRKLNQELDILWGHVTLFNTYQMMTVLASKKTSDKKILAVTPEQLKKAQEEAGQQQQQQPPEEKDYLTLFFDATNELPSNSLRDQVAAQDNSLRAMAGSEKTIARLGLMIKQIYFFALCCIADFWNEKVTF